MAVLIFQVLVFTHDYNSSIQNYLKICRRHTSADHRPNNLNTFLAYLRPSISSAAFYQCFWYRDPPVKFKGFSHTANTHLYSFITYTHILKYRNITSYSCSFYKIIQQTRHHAVRVSDHQVIELMLLVWRDVRVVSRDV